MKTELEMLAHDLAEFDELGLKIKISRSVEGTLS